MERRRAEREYLASLPLSWEAETELVTQHQNLVTKYLAELNQSGETNEDALASDQDDKLINGPNQQAGVQLVSPSIQFCHICMKVFTYPIRFRGHMNRHIGEKVCSTCGLKCNVMEHVCPKAGEKPFCCNACGETFSYIKDIQSHIMYSCSYKCYQNKESGPGKGNRKREMETNLNSGNRGESKRKKVKEKSLKAQMHKQGVSQTAHKDNSKTCPDKGENKLIDDNNDANSHSGNGGESKQKKVKKRSLKVQTRKQAMSQTVLKHNSKTCSDREKEENKLIEDKKDRPYSCHLCCKMYKHKYLLTSHVKSHFQLFRCLVCSKIIFSRDKHNMIRHQKVVHNMREYKFEHVVVREPLISGGPDLQKGASSNFDGYFQNISFESGPMDGSTDRCKALRCPECVKSFDHEGSRRRHMQKHHPDKVPPPIPGGRKRVESQVLNEVMEEILSHVSGEKNYYFRPLVQNKRKALKASVILSDSSKEFPYICPECGCHCASELSFKKHLKTNHSLSFDTFSLLYPTDHQCTVCHRFFPSKRILGMHEDIHSDDRSADAAVVNAVVGVLVSQVECELKGINRYINLRLQCQDCGKFYATRQSLERHALSHGRILDCTDDARLPKPIQIPKPIKPTKIKKGPQDYFQQEDGTYACDICARPFSTYIGVRRHRVIHQQHQVPKPRGTKKFKCWECGITLTTKQCLMNHLKVVHQGTRSEYEEGQLDASLNANTTTVVPLLDDTSTGDIYECSYCGEGFATRDALATHALNHLKDQQMSTSASETMMQMIKAEDIKVEEDQAGFSERDVNLQLETADRGVHLDTWKCNACGETFTVESELEQHLLSHIKEEEEL